MGDDDDFDPEAAERSISEFIDAAEALPAPPVAELADLVGDILREAWDRIDAIMSGQRHNKVLATQLLLGQRARQQQAAGDPGQWQLWAASTLMSGLVARPPGAG